ncbi:MAG: hypothetical protein ACTS8H_02885 [Arsenophonus sp. NC-PE1-MAG3]
MIIKSQKKTGHNFNGWRAKSLLISLELGTVDGGSLWFSEYNSKDIPKHVAPTLLWCGTQISNALSSFNKGMQHRKLRIRCREVWLSKSCNAANKAFNTLLIRGF